MEPTMEAGLEPAGGMKTVPGPVVQIDEGRIQAHLDEVVRATVEETLNGFWMPRRTGCVGRASTNVRRAARIHVRAAMTGKFTPRPGK